jgi:hypothetical protein
VKIIITKGYCLKCTDIFALREYAATHSSDLLLTRDCGSKLQGDAAFCSELSAPQARPIRHATNLWLLSDVLVVSLMAAVEMTVVANIQVVRDILPSPGVVPVDARSEVATALTTGTLGSGAGEVPSLPSMWTGRSVVSGTTANTTGSYGWIAERICYGHEKS